MLEHDRSTAHRLQEARNEISQRVKIGGNSVCGWVLSPKAIPSFQKSLICHPVMLPRGNFTWNRLDRTIYHGYPLVN